MSKFKENLRQSRASQRRQDPEFGDRMRDNARKKQADYAAVCKLFADEKIRKAEEEKKKLEENNLSEGEKALKRYLVDGSATFRIMKSRPLGYTYYADFERAEQKKISPDEENPKPVYGISRLEEAAKAMNTLGRGVQAARNYWIPVELRKVVKAWVELEDGRKYEFRFQQSTIGGQIILCGGFGDELRQYVIASEIPEDAAPLYQRKFRKVDE